MLVVLLFTEPTCFNGIVLFNFHTQLFGFVLHCTYVCTMYVKYYSVRGTATHVSGTGIILC